jgi:hypothetical protein
MLKRCKRTYITDLGVLSNKVILKSVADVLQSAHAAIWDSAY